jgi:hypothetical protein
MRCHLQAMFTSKTIEEYELGYIGARQVIHEDPDMCSKLDVFYHQPERYAGYYLHALEENLGLKGDVAAEQNHSSVCAHLGDGATWQIAEQVSKLLRRQQEQGKQQNEKEAVENARTHRYKSRFKNQTGVDDVLAKKSLSTKAYTRFISATLKPSTSLQTRTETDGSIVVWPAGRIESENSEKVTIQKNKRCSCTFRVKWNALCKHEYKVDGILNIHKFSRRWLSRTCFESSILPSLTPPTISNEETTQPQMSTFVQPEQRVGRRGDGWQDMGFNMNTTLDDDDLTEGNMDPDDPQESDNVIDLCQDEDLCEDDVDGDVEDESSDHGKLGRLSYQSVKSNCEEMCRYVQNDQLQLAELKLLTDRILNRLRNKQNIHASFVDTIDSHPSGEGRSGLPRSAVGRIVPNSKNMKRKRSKEEYMKSFFETGRTNKGTKANASIAATTSTCFQASDENHLAPPKLDHRACSFCKKAHHFARSCPTLLQHGVPPLQQKDSKSRTKLQAELTAVGGIVTYTRDVDDKRTLYTTLPRGIGAIFIFKRLYVKNINEKEHHENYCVECTIYKVGGEEHELYSRSLFLVSCIAKYVVRSSTNFIISLLQYSNMAPPLSQYSNRGPPLSQIQYFPQDMQQDYTFGMSQGLSQQSFIQQVDNSPFANMGFGAT